VIRLEQNYRSQGNILSAANALIAHNKKRLGKNLWTSAGHGEPVRVYEAQSDGYEASWLAEEVQALKRSGLALADMGVLYRSNAQSRIIEHALFSSGIPYRVYGGLRFFERMEIKHALAYLRLAANPDDDGAFLRVANFPARGIGARSLETLQDAAKAGGASLYKAASGLSGKTGTSVAAFVRLVEALKAETQELPLPETVEVMLEKSGLVAHYKAERDGADRVENLNELVNAAAAFVNEAEEHDLSAFLAHASLESGENQAAEGTDALQMMTVHSAKGLEFAAVFVTGLEEGLFPHEQSALEDDGLEEERRLMYVAITRARTRLYLCHAQTRMLHG
jgi:DNA helicase-2/ATP-dependent DNA helicase PcrA